jgi:iron-sulfur cluster assembly accessory protein
VAAVPASHTSSISLQRRIPDDLLVERDGAKVLIDEMSLEFLNGSEIDFSTELIGAAFKINNPNATAACGCGTSFSI